MLSLRTSRLALIVALALLPSMAMGMNTGATGNGGAPGALIANPLPVSEATTVPVSAADPCYGSLKSSSYVNNSANTQLVTASGSTSTYICGISMAYYATSAIFGWGIEYGTGTVCATGSNILFFNEYQSAGTSNMRAEFGFGNATIMATVPAGNNVCMILGGTGAQVSGVLSWVQK